MRPDAMNEEPTTTLPAPRVPRHRLSVRIAHWINVIVFLTLVFSGIAILLAHPRLYWGEDGYYGDPAWLTLPLPEKLDYTGWGRSLHFLAAWMLVFNGAAYLLSGLINQHLLRRMLPTRMQMKLANIRQDIRDHLRLKAHASSGDYNFMQKLAYLVVIFVLFPTIVLTGLTMSPAVTAAWPWLFDLFGGRQSARTIHFLAASSLVLFLLIHLFQVILIGFRKEVGDMITGGRIATPTGTDGDGAAHAPAAVGPLDAANEDQSGNTGGSMR